MTARAARPNQLPRLLTTLRSGMPGFADQAVLSGVSFAAAVVVARAVGPVEFGEFALAYTALLVVTGLQAAFVTQPHNILGARREGEDYARYTGATALVQVVFAGACLVVVLLTAGALAVAGSDHAPLLLAVGAASVTWQALEFTRRVLYTEGRATAALVADLVGWGGYLGALVGLWAADALSSVSAILAIAATTAFGAAVGCWEIRGSLARSADRAALRANWTFARWLAAARVTSWLHTYLYMYLAAAVVGAVASGALRAGQILLGPLNVFLLFLDVVLPIRLSRTFGMHGRRGLDAALTRTYLVTAIPVTAYCAVVALFSEPLLGLVFGADFEAYGSLVVALAVYYVIQYAAQVQMAALSAFEQTRAIFLANIGAAVPALVLGWPLIERFGEDGAPIGMALSALILFILLWLFRRRARDAEAPAPAEPDHAVVATASARAPAAVGAGRPSPPESSRYSNGE